MAQPVKVAHVTTIDATLRFLLFDQLRALRDAGFTVAGVSSPGPWRDELVRAGIRHFPIRALTRRWTPRADLRVLWQLVALFRQEQFDIVHTHMPKTGVLGRLAAWIARVPIVVNTVHGPYGIDPGHPGRWFFVGMERLAARVSDLEMYQGREILDRFVRWGVVDSDRAMHLGNGIDLEHFTPNLVALDDRVRLRAALGIPEDALVVGTVGRVVADKGYHEFAEAAARVRALRSGVEFLAVGPWDPDERHALQDEEVRRAERQGVKFLGLRTDMRELYSLMDIFVLASYHEGFPRSAIEAAAMARPMILTDVRGCREVVSHGGNGLLVSAGAVEPLVQAILRLIDDPALRRRYGAESRRRAVEEFDQRRVHNRIVTAYRALLASRQSQVEHGIGAESPAER